MQAANAWRAELAAALAPCSLTPAQFFVLSALLHTTRRRRRAPTQRQLSDRTGIDVNTTSQILRGLERRALVHRETQPGDTRAVAITLTTPGLQLARAAAREARALNRRYFADVEADPLLAVLSQLAADSQRRRARSKRTSRGAN